MSDTPRTDAMVESLFKKFHTESGCPNWYDFYEDFHEFCGSLEKELPKKFITGEVMEIGDDDDGNPRIVIFTTREQIESFEFLYQPCQISVQPKTT